jgi:hypothetical protein
MSLVLNVEILGEFKKLTQATQGAQTDLQKMTKRADTASKNISRAFAAIGVGLSFKFIANELEQAAKAAIDDTKSQVLLANALKNTNIATDEQIASVEKVIRAYQFSSNVADDELRPAYQKLALTTKSTTEANRLLGVALDIAAGTGKDLNTVTQAMAKALNGSDAALVKLDASFKNAKDPLDAMTKSFAGASEAAADLDPYTRMQRVFGELQETVGMALLPTLEKFAAWVASPEGQEKLDKFVQLITGLAGKFEVLAGFVIDNADQFIAWSGVIVGVGLAIKGLTVGLGIYNGIAAITAARNAAIAASQTAVGATAGTAAVGVSSLAASLRLISALAGTIALVLSLGGDAPKSTKVDQPRDAQGRIINTVPNSPLTTPVPTAPKTGFNFGTGQVTNNVTINTPKVDAQGIVNTLNTATRNGYTGTLRSLKE